jgi:hypothetical protein
MEAEVRNALGWPLRSCSVTELRADHALAIGSLAVTAQYNLPAIAILIPKERPPLSVAFTPADRYALHISQLRQPSMIAVVSISEIFLRTARSLFAPAEQRGHSLCEFRLPLDNRDALRAADLVFCDSVAISSIRHRKAIHYRLIPQESLDMIALAMASYQERDGIAADPTKRGARAHRKATPVR